MFIHSDLSNPGYGTARLGDRSSWRRPYRKHSEQEWEEMEELYRAGVPARALARRYGGGERTIYRQMRLRTALRRDTADQSPRPSTDRLEQAMAEVRRADEATPSASGSRPMASRPASSVPALKNAPDTDAQPDDPCTELAPDASFRDAAQASARTAVNCLRLRDPASAGAYLRIAANLARLDHNFTPPRSDAVNTAQNAARTAAMALLHAAWLAERANDGADLDDDFDGPFEDAPCIAPATPLEARP